MSVVIGLDIGGTKRAVVVLVRRERPSRAGELSLGEACDLLDHLRADAVERGPLAGIGEPLFAVIRETVPRRAINPFAAQTPIVPARLQDDVGIFGAAAVILRHLRPDP